MAENEAVAITCSLESTIPSPGLISKATAMDEQRNMDAIKRRWLESLSVCTEFPAEYAFKAAQDLAAIEHGFTCAMEQLKAGSRFDPLSRSAFLRPPIDGTSEQTSASNSPPEQASFL